MAKKIAEETAAPKPFDPSPAVPNKKSTSGVTGKPPPTGRLVWLCVSGWLVPGLGHWVLGKKIRALILFAAIVSMFLLGLAMKGEFFSTGSGSYLETLGYFGELCVGLAMPLASFFGYLGNPFFVSADYGTAFLVSAGMLNVLAILDAYDIAMGRKH